MDRKQQVCLGEDTSSLLPIHSGIPQGNVIGPLLFNIYLNDITKACLQQYGTQGIKLYADDAKIYGTDANDLQISINQTLSFLQNRQLGVAQEKCFSMTISKPRANNDSHDFRINGVVIENKPYTKDLGIYITENLKWSHHINFITKKASVSAYQILKSFRTKEVGILIHLFKTYVRPKLEHNSEIWSPHLLKDIEKLEDVQKSYTRNIFKRCGISYLSYSDRLQQANLQSLERRRLQKDLVYLYKIFYGYSDINFDDDFILKHSRYNLRRHNAQIKIKNPLNLQTNQYLNSFFIRVVKVWNDLPDEIVQSRSISIFKHKLNSFSFSNFLQFKLQS